jgi:intein/homing endonuclease
MNSNLIPAIFSLFSSFHDLFAEHVMKQITSLTGQIDEKYMYSFNFLNPMQRDVSKNDKNRNIKIPNEISEDLAYLCGIFAGDGSIGYRKKKNEYSIKVVGNPKDEKEFYHQVIGPRFEKVFGIFPKMRYHDSKTTYGFSIYSKTIYLYLTNFIGLPSGVKYSSLKIPELFLQDKKFTTAFIRGVFDTDGCISFKKGDKTYPNYPVINLTSKSANFIRQVSDFLKSIDFKISELYDYKHKDIRIPQGYTIKSSLYINGHKNLHLWNKQVVFYSPKHLEKIRNYSI